MYRGKTSIDIIASLKAAYETAETYPYFVGLFKKNSRIVFQDAKKIKVEIHSSLFKIIPLSWQGEGAKERYKAIRFKQTKGIFKGLTADWIFEEINKTQTRVTIFTAIEKPWLRLIGEKRIGKLIIERTTQGILEELKKKAELVKNG